MSHYRKINVQFKTGQSIISALQDLGMNPQSAIDLCNNGITLLTHWRSFGAKDQQVAIAVQKEDLRNSGFAWTMDGLGFSWNGTGYDLVQDGLPENAINQIKQRYAVHEARRLAMLEGYTVTEQQGDDGTVRLVCNKFSPVGDYGGY